MSLFALPSAAPQPLAGRVVLLSGAHGGLGAAAAQACAAAGATLVLLGLGLQEFSVGPSGLLRIRKIINSVDFSYAKSVADKALTLGTAAEIEAYLAEALPEDLKAFLV